MVSFGNMQQNIKGYLDKACATFNSPDFIAKDPISIPHRYSKLQDIEVSGFWVAMLAWGQRKTIINKATELMALMDDAPHDFILNHQEIDRKRFLTFKHRTFNDIDTLYFLEWLQWYYQQHNSLETAFAQHITMKDENIENALIGFQKLFFSLPDAPRRTQKHIATPARKSACKRLCMFLRWMVREDNKGVDFGLWRQIQPSQLIMPLDVHVDRVGRSLGLITRKQTDWVTAVELTDNLKQYNTTDPVIYDFALFGLGVLEKKR